MSTGHSRNPCLTSREGRGRRAEARSRAHFLISGFTLLEILIAIAVFAIFSAMAYGGLSRLLENREQIDAERTFWRETALGFVRLQQDFSLARNRQIRLSDGITKGLAFQGQPTDIRALGEPNVEFTRGGIYIPNGSTADLQRVAYRPVDGKLMRITWPVLDQAPVTKPVSTPLLNDIEEFEVRFFQNGAWIDRWPPIGQGSQFTALPRAVEVTVSFKGRGKYKRIFLVGEDK